ncbi:MAG: PP2C family protein-serine/threonine phosphatase, partial [Spirochaetota bacterium]
AAMEEMAAINENLTASNSELEHARRIADRDMKMAVNLQQSLYPRIPDTKEWDIAVLFKPMSGVSGDLYDFFMDEKGALSGIGIFDVSGHGIASGLITMLAKTIIGRHFFRHNGRKLSHNMADINDSLITQIGGVDNYLTGLVLKFDGDTVEYVNAGHTDLLFRRCGRGKVSIVNGKNRDIRGGFLGIDQMRDPFASLTFRIQQGDMLLLFTDCLNESKNADGEEYGVDRISGSISSIPEGTAANALDHVMKCFYAFTGTDKLSDDLTVIALRRR